MSVLSGENKPHRQQLEALCGIPRPSCGEKQVSLYIINRAKQLGLEYETDELFNVIVKRPASPGYENAPSLMLQAHTDMVCVKAPDKDIRFETDPIEIYVEDEILRARGTTLGADDGYGAAYLLALMEDEFVHPPLELVFTSQEENGCYGAQALCCASLKSRRMIGLDVMGQGPEYTCTVACFFSDRLRVTRQCALTPAEGEIVFLKLGGIQPVHEGPNVHPEIHNAIKILFRLLKAAGEKGLRFNLVSAEGGEAENYNPAEASAVIAAENAEALISVLSEELDTVKRELDDGRQSIRLETGRSQAAQMLTNEASKAVIDAVYLMPSSTFEMDVKNGTMTATNNVGVLSLKSGRFDLLMSNRAKDKGHLRGINTRVKTIAELCGAHLTVEHRYESWDYNPDSPLLRKTAQLMKEYYGMDMVEAVCPGGLECCDLIPRMPGLDVVMIAPVGGKCHTTDEYLDLKSFDRVYDFLKILIGRLA